MDEERCVALGYDVTGIAAIKTAGYVGARLRTGRAVVRYWSLLSASINFV
jgi:hypothetical protein